MTMKEDEALRLWLFVEDKLAEEEAERVAALSDEEVEAELRAAGVDPQKVITLEQAIARARAKAGHRGQTQ